MTCIAVTKISPLLRQVVASKHDGVFIRLEQKTNLNHIIKHVQIKIFAVLICFVKKICHESLVNT